MKLKPTDLNMLMPAMRKSQLLAMVNDALEVLDRVDNQIKIWSIKDISDIYTKVMQDELMYLRKGRA